MNKIIFHQLADDRVYAINDDPDHHWEWPAEIEVSSEVFYGEIEMEPIEKKSDEVIAVETENGWSWYKKISEDTSLGFVQCEFVAGALTRPSDGKARRMEDQEQRLREQAEDIDIDLSDILDDG